MHSDFKFLNIYKKKKVMVTGSTGFKGSWLSFWLKKLGADVIGVGLKPEKNFILYNSLNLNKLIKQNFLDITNFSKINRLIKKENPDIIFHLAAQSIVSESYTDPLTTIKTNVIGSTNILESVRQNKIKSLVYVTSDKCYRNSEKKIGYSEKDPLGGFDNYSSSKAAAEILFKSYHHSFFKSKKLKYATARAGNVIGGGDMKKNRIVPDVIKSLQKNKTIIIKNPNSTRPWQHVLEPLFGYLKLGYFLMSGKLNHSDIPSWNFGPYKKNCIKVLRIVKMIEKQWSKKKLNVLVKKDIKNKETKLLSLKINKAIKDLNWRPKLNLNENIKLTVEWYKAFTQKKNMEQFSLNQIKFFMKK